MNQKWTRAICTVLTSALVFTGPAVEGTTFSGYINSGLEKVYAKTQKQKDAEKKKSQAEQDLKDKKNEINGLKDQQQTTADDIKNKSAKLDEILAAQKKLQTDITNKQAEIEQNQKDLAAAQEKQQEQYDAMKKRIQFMYENSAEDNIWTAIIESNGITDMLNRIEYVSDVYDSDRALMDSYQAAVEQVKEIGTKLDNDMNELTAMQDDYEKQQADVEAAIVALENQKEQYASQIAQAQQQADNYQNIITAQGKIIQEQEAAAAAAAAAAATGMGVLGICIKDLNAAVHVSAGNIYSLLPQQIDQHCLSHASQIPGDDPVIFLWLHMKLAAGVQINIRRRFAMGDLPGRNNVVEIVIQSHSLQQTAATLHTSCGGNRCTHTFFAQIF